MPKPRNYFLKKEIQEGDFPLDLYLSQFPKDSHSYKTFKSTMSRIIDFLPPQEIPDGNPLHFPWEKFNQDWVPGMMGKIKAAGLKPRSMENLLNGLRIILSQYWRMRRLPDGVYLRIKIPRIHNFEIARGRALTMDEIERLLSVDAPRDVALVAVMFGCGLRRTEASTLTKESFDPKAMTIRVIGKGGKERQVPVAKRFQKIIAAWCLGLKKGDPMFQSESHRSDGGLSPTGVRMVLETVRERAGVEKFTPHDLRRSFATTLLDNDVDISTVQKLMGHSNIATTTLYDRRGDEVKRNAVEKLK